MTITRQRTALIMSFRLSGTSSPKLRRVLFSTFVVPFFTWLLAIYPLFTETQRKSLNHLYYTLLKRVVGGQQWNDFMFSNLYEEISLDDVCYRYWKKYLKKLEKNEDGFLLLEQNALCQHRNKWLEDKHRIQCLYRSKRFVPHRDVLAKILNWMVGHGNEDSIVNISISDLACLSHWPETF